jgi:predicted TIM-barrel fold metal-dependent hydrolase
MVVAAIAVIVALAVIAWPRTETITPTGPQPFVRADLPRIDVHVHVPPSRTADAVRIFAEQGVSLALNASGGEPDGGGLEEQIAASTAVGHRMLDYCNIDWSQVEDPGFVAYATRALDRCREEGAVGLKIYKALGLGYELSDGSLLAIDDPRLDPVFDHAGELGLPVLIHSGDPQAFFRAPTPDNERFAELSAHPRWSFFGVRENGMPWPSWQEVFDQYERRVARSAHTRFLGAHFGNAPEEPETVARMLGQYPNLYVETAARVPEMGRFRAARMREIFVRFHDRILFGTDFQMGSRGQFVLGSSGSDPDPPSRIPFFYEATFRYFETGDRGFAHPTPIQGDWTIDGIALPREVLADFYAHNAERLFHVAIPQAAHE